VEVGIQTLRTHAEATGIDLKGEQRGAMAQVQATHEPPSPYGPAADSQTLVVEPEGVMARYRDRIRTGRCSKVMAPDQAGPRRRLAGRTG
jgi:hypothetical protein